MRSGAAVTVISLEVTETVKTLAESGALILRHRAFTPNDLEGVFLVFCATNDRDLNERIAGEAEKKGLLCNVADIPDASNFIVPAVVERGDLTLAVSTGGTSPAFAKKLRQDLSRQFGEEYAVFLGLMGRIRKKLLAENHDPRRHKVLFEQLVEGGLLEYLKHKDQASARVLLDRVLGPGFSDDDLWGQEE